MTDESKTRKVEQQVQDLELNRETIQDLTELDVHAVRGGVAPVQGPDGMESTRCGGDSKRDY
jgi:hypothetical protein